MVTNSKNEKNGFAKYRPIIIIVTILLGLILITIPTEFLINEVLRYLDLTIKFLEEDVFFYSFLKEVSPHILLLVALFLSSFIFGYIIYKITSIFDSRFSNIFFSKTCLFYFKGGILKNVKIFLERLFALTIGYAIISIFIVQTLFSVYPSFDSIYIPLPAFFAFGVIFSIRLLNNYKEEIAKNLFYGVLFGFFAVSVYSLIATPDLFFSKTIASAPDIVVASILFSLLGDFAIDVYLKIKTIKKKFLHNINRGR